jgi:hypothetical protein
VADGSAQVEVGKSQDTFGPQGGLVRLDDRTTRRRVGTSQLAACLIIQNTTSASLQNETDLSLGNRLESMCCGRCRPSISLVRAFRSDSEASHGDLARTSAASLTSFKNSRPNTWRKEASEAGTRTSDWAWTSDPHGDFLAQHGHDACNKC